jgi:hypothetical protein
VNELLKSTGEAKTKPQRADFTTDEDFDEAVAEWQREQNENK